MYYILGNEYYRLWFHERGKYERTIYTALDLMTKEANVLRRYIPRKSHPKKKEKPLPVIKYKPYFIRSFFFKLILYLFLFYFSPKKKVEIGQQTSESVKKEKDQNFGSKNKQSPKKEKDQSPIKRGSENNKSETKAQKICTCK